MTIFQPDRHLLLRFVGAHAAKFHGFVVDVGGGNGRYRGLFRHVDRFVTLDTDASKNPDILANAENIPLRDSSVDGIICTQMLGDVWNLENTANEMLRILKPEGLLLVTESSVAELHDMPHDYWRFSAESLKRLFDGRCEILILEPRGGYHSLQVQLQIRYLINKYDLYHRPLLGRVVNCFALAAGHFAVSRDRKREGESNITIGYNLLAKKKR